MRTVLAVFLAIVIVVLILFGLHQCGPLDWLNGQSDGDDSVLQALEDDVMQAAVYDDDTEAVAAPDYTTVRLPEAERLQLEADARDYIQTLAEPTTQAMNPDDASQFVGAEQTFVIDGETITLVDLIDGAANAAAFGGGTENGSGRQLQQADNGNIYYVHSVLPTDSQGIWGVIQTGLKYRFGRGLGMKRGEATQVFQVDIPNDADEKVANQSSFLGRVLHQKVRESMVYNQQNGKIGRNPDVIFPGQELVIIEFKPDELIAIYEYFITDAQL